MKPVLLLCAVAMLLPPCCAMASQNPAGPSADTSPSKKIFTAAGCAKCHDADGSKKLADGTTLLGRLAKTKDPESRLATRLKNEQERHQVFLYLQPMIERERLSGTPQGSEASPLK